MAMMILKDIKLFGGLIYIISWLSNHLIYYRHKKINSKIYLEHIWKLIFEINRYDKMCFVLLLLDGKDLSITSFR